MRLLIKPIRKRRRMSLRDLSKLTGISKSYLSQLENTHNNLTLDKLQLIANALEVCPLLLIKCDRNISCEFCSYCEACYNIKKENSL